MAKSKNDRRDRLVETVIVNVGAIRAYRVMLFISCWGICTQKLGRPPVNVEEYSDWWRMSRSQGFREQQLFRDALPMHRTPTDICTWLLEQDPEIFSKGEAAAAFRVGALL
jgi:hypothetical protein